MTPMARVRTSFPRGRSNLIICRGLSFTGDGFRSVMGFLHHSRSRVASKWSLRQNMRYREKAIFGSQLLSGLFRPCRVCGERRVPSYKFWVAWWWECAKRKCVQWLGMWRGQYISRVPLVWRAKRHKELCNHYLWSRCSDRWRMVALGYF